MGTLEAAGSLLYDSGQDAVVLLSLNNKHKVRASKVVGGAHTESISQLGD